MRSEAIVEEFSIQLKPLKNIIYLVAIFTLFCMLETFSNKLNTVLTPHINLFSFIVEIPSLVS